MGHISVFTGGLSTKDLARLKYYGDAPNHNEKVQARMGMSPELSGLTGAELDRVYMKCLAEDRLPSSRAAERARASASKLLHPIGDRLNPKTLATLMSPSSREFFWGGVGEGKPTNPDNLDFKLNPDITTEQLAAMQAGGIVYVTGASDKKYDEAPGKVIAEVLQQHPDRMPEQKVRKVLTGLSKPALRLDRLNPNRIKTLARDADILTGLAMEAFVDGRKGKSTTLNLSAKGLSHALDHLHDISIAARSAP